jgi:alpha-tubulin suppressor-like RCC1 family protein
MKKNSIITSLANGTRLFAGRSARLAAGLALVLATVAGSSIAYADSNETSVSDPNVVVNASFSVGDYNACYILPSTSVKCWGYNNRGAVGDGTFVDATTPKDVVGLTNVKAVSSAKQTCALTISNEVKCWGTSKGNGTSSHSSTPVLVTGFSATVTALASGGNTVCAVLSTGALECWGSNWWGQIGDGTQTDSLTPVQVSGLSSGVLSASIGDSHACALLTTGAVKCWGQGPRGQLGDNSNSSTARLILFRSQVSQAELWQLPQVQNIHARCLLQARCSAGAAVTMVRLVMAQTQRHWCQRKSRD